MVPYSRFYFGGLMGGWVVLWGKLFVRIERSLSSKRQMSSRASITSTGKLPTNGLQLVDVGEGIGFNSTGWRVLMAGAGCLKEEV